MKMMGNKPYKREFAAAFYFISLYFLFVYLIQPVLEKF